MRNMSWIGEDTSRVRYQQGSNQEIECYGLLSGQGFWIDMVEQILGREGQEGYQAKNTRDGQMAIGVHDSRCTVVAVDGHWVL